MSKLVSRMAVGLCALCLAAAGQLLDNLVPDPGFETGSTGLPEGWNINHSPDGACSAEVVEGGHESEHALLIKGKGKWCSVVSGVHPLDEQLRYVASGWVQVEGEGATTIKLDFFKGGRWLGETHPGWVKAGGDWQFVRVLDDRRPFPEAERITFTLGLVGDVAARFDDLSFVVRAADPEETGNLLGQGSFESGVGDRPAGGRLHHLPGKPTQAIWSTEWAIDGERGVRLQTSGPFAWFGLTPIKAEPGVTYELSGWVRPHSGQALLRAVFLKKEGAKWDMLGYFAATAPPTLGEWSGVALAAWPDQYPGATHVSVAAGVEAPGAMADFDGLRLLVQGGEEADAPEPPPEP